MSRLVALNRYQVVIITPLKTHEDDNVLAVRASEAVRQVLCDAALPDDTDEGTIKFGRVKDAG